MSRSHVYTRKASFNRCRAAGFLREADTSPMDVPTDRGLAKKAMRKAAKMADGIMCEAGKGADRVWMPDPTSSGDIISGDLFREFVHPELSSMVARRKGRQVHPVRRARGPPFPRGNLSTKMASEALRACEKP